ncbi:MAG: SGNH/GDSL hydrolase family protein [Bacilli bacterium]|nr:SGNH/GDSL hydrolase family protein [Bacilli bacterium]
MKIEELDENFKERQELRKQYDVYFYPSSFMSLYGLMFNQENGFYRLPWEVAHATREALEYHMYFTAGGRLIFSTNSKCIGINVKWKSLDGMPHMAITGQAGFVLKEKVGNKEEYIATMAPDFGNNDGFRAVSPHISKRGMRTYILYFPLYNRVSSIDLILDKGAKVAKVERYYKDVPPFLYYGSSITQGGCASRSDNSYQNFICEHYGVDFINMGMTGQAKGEEPMAKYLASLDCSLFVYDYDHNAPNTEHLKQTHEPFFLEFRKSHPTTPVIMISMPTIQFNDTKARRDVIEETYKKALARGDKNVYFIDGKTIYPNALRDHCTVDGCHPTDLGFYFFAKRLMKTIDEIIKEGKIY